MPAPRSKIRLQQLTGSIPISTGSAHAAAPKLQEFQQSIDEIASSIRRILDFDTVGTGFFEAPKTFKSMGTENRFVILDASPGGLFVSGTTYTTQITGSSGVGIKADSGNVEIEGTSGVSFSENGAEVIIIDSNRDTRFSHTGGTATDPDVEFDGFVRFDGNAASSGSVEFIGTSNQSISKSTSGRLTLSGSAGQLTFIDTNVQSSTWSDKNYGIPLSTNASQWSTIQSLGFVSLLDAIANGGSNDKVSGSIGASGVPAGNKSGVTFNVSNIPAATRKKRIDVFINGVLLTSGSAAERGSAAADYNLDLSSGLASADVRLAMALVEDDILTVILR